MKDRKALLALRQRLFHQGLDLMANSNSNSPDVESVHSAAASATAASIDDSTPSVEPNGVWVLPRMLRSPSDKEAQEEDDDDDASTLIRRRLFAAYPSRHPLDTTDSSLSDGPQDRYASPVGDGKDRAKSALVAAQHDSSLGSTVAPVSPDGKSPQSQFNGENETPSPECNRDSSSLDALPMFSADSGPIVSASPLRSEDYEHNRSCYSGGAMPSGPGDTATSENVQSASHSKCELWVDDFTHMKDFERLNDTLRRQGFDSIPHRLENEPASADSSAPRSHIVADGPRSWSICLDVLAAYEDRGRRLRDASIAQRSEDRRSRDSRIKSLLQENQRLEAEVKKCRESIVSAAQASSPQPASAARSLTAEKELAELALKLKAAEALARHRERELDQLRMRLDQAVAESARRQEREREALAKPLRRRAATRDDPLLSVAVAHQARAEALQAELHALTKHSHTLTFKVEAAEEKCRKLEAQQQFRPNIRSRSRDASGDVAQASELDLLRQNAAREAELRARAEEQLQEQAEVHARDSQALGKRLRELEAHSSVLEAERQEAAQSPSAGELRWQREALRLRDELAEARRAWRTADPRTLMRRDKEIQSLGLAPRELEDSAKKADLVAILLDVCRVLRVGDITQVVPKASALAELGSFQSGVVDVLQELGKLPPLSDKNGGFDRDDVLWSLRGVATELRSLQADMASREAAAARGAAEKTQGKHVAEEGIRALAAELQLPQNVAPTECLKKVTELRIGGAVLDGIAAQLQCHEFKEVPQRLEALLRLCDERVAAQRIVEALQKLLRADSIQDVLPALREVLDVAALRRRTVQHNRQGNSHSGASTAGEKAPRRAL
jgi:hypothetical protein